MFFFLESLSYNYCFIIFIYQDLLMDLMGLSAVIALWELNICLLLVSIVAFDVLQGSSKPSEV